MFSKPRKKPLGFKDIKNNKLNFIEKKNIAISFYDEKKLEEALKLFEELLTENKRDPQIYIFIGIIKAIKEERDEAITLFNKAKDIDNKIPEIYFNLGKAYSLNGKLDLAILNYKKSIDINPKDSLSYKNLVIILLKTYQKHKSFAITANKNTKKTVFFSHYYQLC